MKQFDKEDGVQRENAALCFAAFVVDDLIKSSKVILVEGDLLIGQNLIGDDAGHCS